MVGEVVFLHGLEARVDDAGVPQGGKASYLRERFGAATPALDTRAAQRVARAVFEASGAWSHPFEGYDEAFAVPLARARAAIGEGTRLVIGSSFGGAVLLRLLHEAPVWRGPVLLLAGAGPKLTPYRSLPEGVRALVVHGRDDEVVPFDDSVRLAASSSTATLCAVDDAHRLASVVNDEGLGAWVRELVAG